MSEKKRKSASKESERPNKKQQTAGHVQVRHVSGPDVAKPIIASSPGTIFPDVKFQSFTKSIGGKPNLLLQSTDHSSLNHTAREDDTSTEKHLKHYVAVFDPATGNLQVTEAKRVTVRSALRTAAANGQEEEEADNIPISNYTSRAALTAAFGTKKSKKAVQSMAENRLLAQGTEGDDNPISTAMLSNVTENDDLNNEVSLAESLSNKPLPPADLGTNEIDQVYSLDMLVLPSPARTTLEMMPVNVWVARISAKKEVQTRTRFVANRVGNLVTKSLNSTEGEDAKLTKTIQLLRYIQLLQELHTYVTRLPRRQSFPPVDKWPDHTISMGTPMVLVQPIMDHFFPDHIPKEPSVTLLRTTILALTLHIPPPSLIAGSGLLITEPTDMSMDMAIDASEIRKLYRELGCKLSPPTEQELIRWGMEKVTKKRKEEGAGSLPKPVFARLKFPLEFPKVSRGKPMARR